MLLTLGMVGPSFCSHAQTGNFLADLIERTVTSRSSVHSKAADHCAKQLAALNSPVFERGDGCWRRQIRATSS